MEEEKENNKTTDLAKEMLNSMGVSYEEVIMREEGGVTTISVYSQKDSKILIGKQGANLLAITLLLNMMAKKKYDPDIQVFVDVNDYQKENLDLIKQKALTVADRVKSFQVNMELDPMNSLERRFVHSLFSNDPYVSTHSKGMGKERRIVVELKKQEEEI
ncbi:MAG: protein jag [Patescibacteria group bacterium]